MSLKTRLSNSVGVRLTLWYSGIFILSAAALFAITFFFLDASLQREDRKFIQDKLHDYAERYRAGGLPEVAQEVAIEKDDEGDDPFYLRLTDNAGKTFFSHMPREWSAFGGPALDA